MNACQAENLGAQVATLVQNNQVDQAYALLAPVLAARTPFRLLDRIGQAAGAAPSSETDLLLDRIAAGKTEGGWVIIGSALAQQLSRDFDRAFARCRAFIVAADVWYGADILGERVPGPALVISFEPALAQLVPWRQDASRWVRRAAGVAVHFWAKRSHSMPELSAQAEALLAFLEPMFGEWEIDAAKGIGWGLKTLGKHYPALVFNWLDEQVVQKKRRYRALMLRKATAYLSEEQRAHLTGGEPRRETKKAWSPGTTLHDLDTVC